MKLVHAFVLAALLVLIAPQAQSHHNSGSSGSRLQGLTRLLTVDDVSSSVSQAYLSFEATRLDGSIGTIYSSVIGGDLALTDKIAVGAFLPFSWLDHGSRSSEFGLGDAGFSLRYTIWGSKRLTTKIATTLVLPTGDEKSGLGSGQVSQSVNVFQAFKFAKATLFASAGTAFEYEGTPAPQFLGTLGLSSARFFDNRMNASLTLINQTILSSAVFKDGSGKVFLEPQLNFFWGTKREWVTSLAFKLSVYDYLSPKAGITLTSTNNVLFNDVLFSGRFSLGYTFK